MTPTFAFIARTVCSRWKDFACASLYSEFHRNKSCGRTPPSSWALLGGIPVTRGPVMLTATDAVFVLALIHYIDERADHREVVTEKAALKIAGLANAFNLGVTKPLTELGLRIRRGVIRKVPEEVFAHACALVLKHQTQERVRAVAALCKGKAVAEVEQLDVEALVRGRR